MDVSLESVPRKGLLSEKVSSLPSVQRSYISDRAQLVSEWVGGQERRKGTKEFKVFSAEELVIGRVRRDLAVIVCNCVLEPNKSSWQSRQSLNAWQYFTAQTSKHSYSTLLYLWPPNIDTTIWAKISSLLIIVFI
jgi:hypothetical protein